MCGKLAVEKRGCEQICGKRRRRVKPGGLGARNMREILGGVCEKNKRVNGEINGKCEKVWPIVKRV